MVRTIFLLITIWWFSLPGISQNLLNYSGPVKSFKSDDAYIETYSYYLKDGKEIKHGAYKCTLEGPTRVIVTGQFIHGLADSTWRQEVRKIEKVWTDQIRGLSKDYPYKRLFIANYKNGKPDGKWIERDTLKDGNARGWRNVEINLKDGRLVGPYIVEGNTWIYCIPICDLNSVLSCQLMFDENGFLNSSGYTNGFPHIEFKGKKSFDDLLFIGYYEEDPTQALGYYNIDQKIYIDYTPDKIPQVYEDFACLVDNDLLGNQPFEAVAGPIQKQFIIKKFNWIFNDSDMQEFLSLWDNTPYNDRAQCYNFIYLGDKALSQNDASKAKEMYDLALKKCQVDQIKLVIEDKLKKVNDLLTW